MASRHYEIENAIKQIDPRLMVTDRFSEENWLLLLSRANESKDLILMITPLFTCISQWVQVLSSQNMVTISLVRHFVRQISDELDKLKVMVETLRATKNSRQANICSCTSTSSYSVATFL